MKKLMFILLMLFATSSLYATSHRCVGMDAEGNKVNVLYDEDTNTVNVNGTVYKIESGTQGKNGVATENFKTEDDEDAYLSLVVEDQDNIILRQYNAADDSEQVRVPLACE